MDKGRDGNSTALLRLLEGNPDPPPFCLHRALLGSTHKCEEHDNVKLPQSMAVPCTPVQLRKITSPQNLELDSDTSSMAGWSLSMATPTVLRQATVRPVSNLLSTTCESTLTEDACASILTDESILGGVNGSSVKEDKIKKRVVINRQTGHKPVVRTLFPRKNLSDGSPQFDFLSPIPNATTPLMTLSQDPQPNRTTSPHTNSTLATLSLFETPSIEPENIGLDDENEDKRIDAAPCSQELFGSPEIFTPKKPAQCNPDSKTEIDSLHAMIASQDCDKADRIKGQFADFERGCLVNSPEECVVNTPGTHLLLNSHPLVHSTPLYPVHHHVDSDSPVYPFTSVKDCAPYQTPMSHVSQSIAIPDTAHCNSATPHQRANTEPKQQTPSIAMGDEDIFDILFMSKSQLESRLNSKNNETGSANDVVKEHSRSGCEGEGMAEMECDSESVLLESNTKPLSQVNTECRPDNTATVSSQTDTKSSDLESQPPPKRKRVATKSFFYPSKKRLTKSRRKRMRIRETKTDTGTPNTLNEQTSISETVDSTSMSPPHKKVCVESTVAASSSESTEMSRGGPHIVETRVQDQQAVTSIDESFVADDKQAEEHIIEVQESQDSLSAIDDSFTHHSQTLGESQGNDDVDSNSKVSSELIGMIPEPFKTVPEMDSGGHAPCDLSKQEGCSDYYTPISSIITIHSACVDSKEELVPYIDPPMPAVTVAKQQSRVSGLRRSFGGNLHKRSFKQTDESNTVECIKSSPSERHSETTLNPVVPSSKQALTENIAEPELTKCAPFAGFQTASGGSIAISETALNKAKQLIGEDLQYEKTPTDTSCLDLINSKDPIPSVSLAISDGLVTPGTVKTIPPLIAVTTPSIPMPPIASSFVTPGRRQTLQTPSTLQSSVTKTGGCRPKGKPFKAPRFAGSVSNAEERASVARILKNFGVSGVKSDSTPSLKARGKDKLKEKLVETGFSTAGGTKLSASHSSMMRAKRLLVSDKENGVDSELMSDTPSISNEAISKQKKGLAMTGFRTASGRGLSVSTTSLEQANQLIAKEDAQSSKASTSMGVNGFHTASGKNITVSSEALSRAKSIVDTVALDISSLENTPKHDNPSLSLTALTGFKTAGGSMISVSEKSLKTAQKLADEMRDEPDLPSVRERVTIEGSDEKCMTGFSTAGGRYISVCRDSIMKAEKIISDKEPTETAEKLTPDRQQGCDETDSFNYRLSAKEVESLDCFTQIDFHAREVSPPMQTVNTELNMNGDVFKKKSFQDLSVLENDESASCYFSTQVVKQFLDFSGEDDNMESDSSREQEKTNSPVPSQNDKDVQTPTKNDHSDDSLQPETPDIGGRLLDNSGSSVAASQSLCNYPRTTATCTNVDKEPKSVSREQSPTCLLSPSSMTVNVSAGIRLSDLEATFSSEPTSRLESTSNLSAMKDAFTKSMIDNMDTSSMSCCQECNEETSVKEQDEKGTEHPSIVSSSQIPSPHNQQSQAVTLDFSHIQRDSQTDISSQVPKTEEQVHIETLLGRDSADSCEDMDTTLCVQHDSKQTTSVCAGVNEKGLVDNISRASSNASNSSTIELANTISEGRPSSHQQSAQVPDSPEQSVPDTSPGTSQVDIHVGVTTSKRHQGKSKFAGLMTARGAKVDISEEALSAVRLKFSDTSFPGLQTASGKEVSVSDESLLAVRARLGDFSGEGSSTAFPGLQTATGKEVSVSDESLLAVRARLGDFSGEGSSTAFPGLQTASGKEVSVSDESFLAVRARLGDFSGEGSSTAFPGLQTASGKEVSVSDESLLAVRARLGNVNGEGNSTAFPGLRTASGKEVTVSEQSRQAVRAILRDDDGNNDHKHSFSSFQTVSGEASEQAIPNTQSKTFPGLQTASGKQVEISDESLQAARATLENDQVAKQMPSIELDYSDRNLHISGFQTAGGKSVTVSEEALTAVRSSLANDSLVSSFQPPLATIKTIGQSSSNSQTTTTATPTSKYRPVFKVGASKEQQERSNEQSSSKSNHTQRRLGTSNRGLVSTPEGALRDRHPSRGHRALLPTQTYLNEDGSYTVTQSRDQRIYTTPHRTRNRKQLNSASSLQGSGPSHVNRGSLNKGTKSVSAQNLNSCTGQGRGFTTPASSQRHVPKNVTDCTPVWKTSIGAPKTGRRVCQSGAVDTVPLHSGHVKVLIQSSKQQCKSYEKHLPVPNTVDSINQLSSEPVSTSTQAIDPSTPFGPLHITLSQVYAMEDSQNHLDIEGDKRDNDLSDKGKSEGGGKNEDSGYVSREVSSVRSPSPEEKAAQLGTELSTPHADKKEQCLDVDDDTLSAEVALEFLNDSLDMDCDNDVTNETPVVCESSSLVQEQRLSSNLDPPMRNQVAPSSITSTSKQIAGTLLSLRSSYTRISFRSSINHRPPGGYSVSDVQALGVSESTLSVSSSNAKDYQFQGRQFFSSSVLRGALVCVGDGVQLALRNGLAGVNEFWEAFRLSPGVDERLISFSWFSNHYSQLVWKCASMEVAYPHLFAGRCLTPDWLLLQIKYRYDREIDRAERSAIHKICEHDDLPSRRMVLCVSHIRDDKLVGQPSGNVARNSLNETSDLTDTPCIELTDGWYTLPCVLDRPLKYMIKTGKITVGTKLMIFGAELLGLSSPCHPLEIPELCSLKISANSTRRARWFAKLGYQATPHSFLVPLTSVYSDGGMVGCTDMVITRVYPLVYLEKKEGAKSVFRSERLETKIAVNSENERQKKIEKICSRVQKDFEEEMAKKDHQPGRRRRSRRLNTLQIKQLQDGEEIHTALNNAPDPIAFQELLSHTQRVLLESYHQCLVSQRQAELQEKIQAAIQEAEESLPQKRNVTPLLKVRVVPCGGRQDVDCLLSVWRPGGHVQDVLKAGNMVRVTNLNTLPARSNYNASRLQLTATRSTIYRTLTPTDPAWALKWYTPREYSSISFVNEHSSTCRLPHGELDTVGVVVCIVSGLVMSHDSGEGSERILDSVFLADSEGKMLLVKVWDGLEARALHDIVKQGALLAVLNLTYRGIDYAHKLPTGTAGDCTLFSQRPHDQHLKVAMENLKQSLPVNLSEYLQTLDDRISVNF